MRQTSQPATCAAGPVRTRLPFTATWTAFNQRTGRPGAVQWRCALVHGHPLPSPPLDTKLDSSSLPPNASLGLDVRQPDVLDFQPVHYAAAEGHRGCLKFLVTITHGSVLDAANGRGETPLQLAQRMSHQDCVNYLTFLLNERCGTQKLGGSDWL